MTFYEEIKMIAKELRTGYEGKKHGGYEIYEDDKIKIKNDTFAPNLFVYVKVDGKEHLVLLRSRGNNQEHHQGKWEQYLHNLYPKALKAREEREAKEQEAKTREKNQKFGPASKLLNSIFE